MSEYNVEATQKLIKGIKEMEPFLKRSISADERAQAERAGRIPLDTIIEALEEGADPLHTLGKPLFAMICAYPFEKPGNVPKAIQTAIRLGVDVRKPITVDTQKACTSIIRSPLADMVLLFQHIGSKELERRLHAILNEIKNADLEKILAPEVVDPIDGNTYIQVPLLCEMFEQPLSDNLHSIFRSIMSHFKTPLEELPRNECISQCRILNEPIRVMQCNGEKLLLADHSDPSTTNLKGIPDEFKRIVSKIGDRPFHALVRNKYERDIRGKDCSLPEMAAQLVEKGADPQALNREGLTPYGLACSLGIGQIIRSPSLLSIPPKLVRSELHERGEFYGQDRMGRLILTRMLDGLSACLRRPDGPPVDNAFEIADDADCRYANLDKGIECILDIKTVFLECLEYMMPHYRNEYRNIFSAALPFAIKADRPVLAECLLDMGADPRYTEPGRLPVWKNAVLKWGERPETLNLLRHANLTENERQSLMNLHAPNLLAALKADARQTEERDAGQIIMER